MQGALDTVQGKAHSCEPPPAVKPQCGQLTDDLCQALWSSKNQGRLKVSDGEILRGTSKNSKMSAARIEDFKALIDSEPQLPEDLRKKAKPILQDLKVKLAKEKDSKEWYKSVSSITERWNEAVGETAVARVEKADPALKLIPDEDLTVEQLALYRKESFNLKGQILEAKYAEHPNWRRIEGLFDQVKKDLVAEIQGLEIDDQQKQAMLKRIDSVKLSLPYPSPDQMDASDSCASTEVNAFYSAQVNSFSVCAGMFNSFQSESALYFVMAHEISHSVDPLHQAEEEMHKRSSFISGLNALVSSEGPRLTCDKWQGFLDQAQKIQPQSTPKKFDSMQSLYDCLQPKGELAKYDPAAIQSAAERLVNDQMDGYASDHFFLNLAQPSFYKAGKLNKNEFYMRPDRLGTKLNSGLFLSSQNRDANPMEIFTQALACVSQESGGKEVSYQDAPQGERAQLFKMALQDTQKILIAKNAEWFSYCGRNCRELASDHISVDSRENFSDWLGSRAMSRHLGRKKDLREAREASAVSTVLFCDEPSAVSDAPDLAAVEKKYSFENHPDHRVRRISVFNKKNASVVKCDIKEQEQGFGLCEP
jgi:hypothetical protein